MAGCDKFQTSACKKCEPCYIRRVGSAGKACEEHCVSSSLCRNCIHNRGKKAIIVNEDTLEWDAAMDGAGEVAGNVSEDEL